MKDPEIRALLISASKLTQDIGRQIGSTKIDPGDLEDLIEALETAKTALETIRSAWIESFK